MTKLGGSGRWHRARAAGRVRALRKRLGLTQRAFADAVGVSYDLVTKWEVGKRWPTRLAEHRLLQMEQEADNGDE